jgi:putative flippase GtrA
LKFNAVGIIGAGVQLSALALLSRLELHYLLATALAVETAVLHNYAWHRAWTWKDRPGGGRPFLRFHLANGLTSLVSNLALMTLLTGWLGLKVVPANLIAITATSLLNFLLGDRWVFARATV